MKNVNAAAARSKIWSRGVMVALLCVAIAAYVLVGLFFVILLDVYLEKAFGLTVVQEYILFCALMLLVMLGLFPVVRLLLRLAVTLGLPTAVRHQQDSIRTSRRSSLSRSWSCLAL